LARFVYTISRQREGKNLLLAFDCLFPKLMGATIDRRTRQRVVTRLSARLRSSSTAAGSELTAETRDVSTNGVFLYTKSRMAEGSDFELVLILPPELTSGEKCWVCCHARVVRVEQGAGTDFGVAAEIRRIDILPEIPA
jgi:hypothetical protein